jgi:ATP-dependent nuclease, subunit B
LYAFLTNNHVFEVLLTWQQQATEEQNLTLANQPEQIVNLFNQILDEYVTVFGEKEFESTDFISILDAAFENATYSQIPFDT